MGIELGRISGPLLSRNLARDGVDLAFETDLLYLQVTDTTNFANHKIGIKNSSPARLLTVTGTTRTTNLIADTQADIANFTFSTNVIADAVSSITLSPNQATDPVIATTKIATANLEFTGNSITNTVNNSDIVIDPIGTGQVIFNTTQVDIRGDLHATGNVTWDGDITFGNDSTDNVSFSADINSSVVPNLNNTYNLGSVSQEWANLYSHNVITTNLVSSGLTVNDINQLLTQGKTIYVSTNGNDTTGTGTHLQSTYKTVAKALSVATAGDNIYIYPGTYLEILPLTVPTGVSVTGAGLRSVTIKPATGYETQDVFKLNGETTISNLTVSGYSVGSAFSFASNITVSTRSPYVFNVTVIPKTYPALSAVASYHNMGNPSRTPLGFEFNIDGTVMYVITTTSILAFNLPSPYYYQYVTATTTPNSAYTLTSNIYSKITFKPDGTRLYISEQNKLRQFSLSTPWDITTLSLMGDVTVSGLGSIQFSTDGTKLFARATSGLRVYQLSSAWDITAGSSLTTITFSPFTICSGFYFDSTGSTLYVVSSSSLIKVFALTTPWSLSSYSLLKIITGNSDSVSSSIPVSFKVINGLFYTLGNGFMYVGQETVASGNGAVVDGSLANSSSKEASMLFHAVTIIAPNGIGVSGTNGARIEWLNSFSYYADKGIYLTQGTLGFASLGVKFGAEMRSINSANVYGTYGTVADGANTLAYLIGHNFGYVGTATNDYNDQGLVQQANEVVTLNNGKVYFDSVDHKGDYRIGDIFYINQETGRVTFNSQAINFNPSGSIILEGPTSTTTINAQYVETGNLRFHDNNIDSNSGPVNFKAISGQTYLNTNVNVAGNVDISNDFIIGGNLFLGNQATDNITFLSNITQDLLPDDVGGPFTLGSSSVRWNVLYNKLLNVDGVTQLSNNTITTLTTNTDLKFVAAGTGQVKVTTTDVKVNNNLTTGNNFTVSGTSMSNLQNTTIVGTVTQTGDTYLLYSPSSSDLNIIGNYESGNIFADYSLSTQLILPQITISSSNITATSTNSDLVFSANGTGGVIFENSLKFLNNEIFNTWISPTTNTQRSIKFSPNGTGNVKVDSTKAIQLPVGNSSTRTLSTNGEIRFNSTYSNYEGFDRSGLQSLNQLYSNNRATSITAEDTSGANTDTLTFRTNSTTMATITSTALFADSVLVDNVKILADTISNNLSNTDLYVTTIGSANTSLDGIPVTSSKIYTPTNQSLTIQGTGEGYVKFTGNGAVVMPYGPTEDRRVNPENGELRYNGTENYMEVFSATNGWIPAVGASGAASLEQIEYALSFWTLILG